MIKVRVRFDKGLWKMSFFINLQYVGNLMMNDKQYLEFMAAIKDTDIKVDNIAKTRG